MSGTNVGREFLDVGVKSMKMKRGCGVSVLLINTSKCLFTRPDTGFEHNNNMTSNTKWTLRLHNYMKVLE